MTGTTHPPILPEITEAQRMVLDCFSFSWVQLTVKDIRERIKEYKSRDVSLVTVRRATAKLVELGVLQCLGSHRVGRGYSNLYCLIVR